MPLPRAAHARGKTRAVAPQKNIRPPGNKKKGAAADPLARVRELAERGAFGAAILAAEAVIDSTPAYWPAWRTIFSILSHLGRFEDALRVVGLALESVPPSDPGRVELTVCFAQAAEKTGQRLEQALELTTQTATTHGSTVSLVWHIPRLVSLLGRSKQDVLAAAESARGLCPAAWESHFNMSAYLIAAGHEEESVSSFARILRPYVQAKARPPAEIVQQYAPLASTYEGNPLQVYFSTRMAEIILATLQSTKNMRILDAGCGTGLLGTRIEFARLVGIDLSPDMLAMARGRGIYDELVEGDLAAAMAARTDTFDIVASSCVLYHVADLLFLFRESARLLVPGGHLFFSVDPAPDSMDIGVTPLGEYAHSRRYLRRLASETGFTEISIKTMAHRATPGFWCAFRRA